MLMPLTVPSADHWGYCTATVTENNDKGQSIEYVFVSDLIQLSTLKCINESAEDFEQKRIEACIKDWFYNRLKSEKQPAAQLVEKENITGMVGAFPEFAMRYIYGKNVLAKDSLNYKENYAFMNKDTAIEKRKVLIEMARDNNKVVVIVR
jgi:hypothetical protein